MKRLFLASSGLSYIEEFITRKPAETRMLFIPTAGNLDTDVWWIDKDRDVLTQMGFTIIEKDIVDTSKDVLCTLLESIDIVYIAGGNTFYLLKQLHDTGFDKLLTDYVNRGGLYAGASAGAIIAGRDIAPVATIDEPEKVDGLTSTIGLGFIDAIPIPHYDMTERTVEIDKLKTQYQGAHTIVLLTDDQAIVVEGDSWRLVDSKRTTLELEWCRKTASEFPL